MGQVYLARDPKLDRQVAIKLLNHHDDPNARALFEREAKVLASLNHPNIVTVFEIADVEDGRQLIAMEYLPGRALRDLLQHDAPARDDVVAICGQVAIALAAAHEADILHRDIKPENVVVGRALSVKVVDFGIARRLDTAASLDPATPRRPRAATSEIVDVFTQTLRADLEPTLGTEPPKLTGMTRTVFGTPAYMAPEVLMGDPSSTASDVYSLGVMLYECLTGRRPYEAPSLHEVIARVIDGGDPPARIDDPLAELVARMIDRDPAKRPPLVEIVRTLSRRRSLAVAPAPRRRTRWLVLVAVVVGCVGGLVAWRLSRSALEPAVVQVIDRGPIAIASLELELPSYGIQPDGLTFARVLVQLLDSAHVTALPPEVGPLDGKAKLIARGSIVERAEHVIARIELVDVDTNQPVRVIEVTGDSDRMAQLLLEVADEIAGFTLDGSHVDRTNPKLAANLLQLGKQELRESRSNSARTFLEQAVLAGPSAEAWTHYTTSLAVIAAKRSALIDAARAAYEAAPTKTRKQLLHASLLIHEAKFEAALAELAPLEQAGLQGNELRDLLFAIGECHWHEGRHDRGFLYFKRTLELDGAFAEAARHVGEYALVRRDEATAREYTRFQRLPMEHVDFAMGRYQSLVTGGKQPFDEWARFVLGLAPAPTSLTPRQQTYEHLVEAAIAADSAAANKQVEALLGELEPYTAYTATLLVTMAEVVVAAEMKDPARRLLDELARRSPTYNYHRIAILASPMLGAPKFPRSVLTERLATLVTAIDAELAGDRVQAAKTLRQLVDNPTFEWDFLERLALKRNLDALGRKRDARALCDDTLKPVVMRHVFRVVRRICTT